MCKVASLLRNYPATYANSACLSPPSRITRNIFALRYIQIPICTCSKRLQCGLQAQQTTPHFCCCCCAFNNVLCCCKFIYVFFVVVGHLILSCVQLAFVFFRATAFCSFYRWQQQLATTKPSRHATTIIMILATTTTTKAKTNN